MYTYILALILMIPALFYAAERERSPQADALFAKYNPTYDRCRPKLRMGAAGPEVDETSLLALNDAESAIACMIAGFKQVSLIGVKELTLDLRSVLKEYRMGFILIGNSDRIMYTQQGKRAALLLAKEKVIGSLGFNSAYLVGFLLSYSDPDIKALYDKNGWVTFDSDKKKAHAWIEANSKDIEQWIADNALKYNLSMGEF
jgi:hypothetical protein